MWNKTKALYFERPGIVEHHDNELTDLLRDQFSSILKISGTGKIRFHKDTTVEQPF